MTPHDLPPLVAQYRAGLEAEMTLLHRLEWLAARQRDTSENGDLEGFTNFSDQRDRVMAGLVTIEHELKPIRMALLEYRKALDDVHEFQDVATLHREAAAMVERIVTQDRNSLEALKEAELARRFAAQSLGQGESTLAAYRRVVAPPLGGPNLVNRKG
jgi:hypothetical protein